MKTTIAALFITISTICLGQDVNKEIEADFIAYSSLISEKNVEAALDYTNPKLFELFPREQMKSMLEAVYNMPNIEYKTGVPTFLKFDSVKQIDSVFYVKFYIISPIEMKFTDIEVTPENVSGMTKSLEARFGYGKVAYDEATGFFIINAEKIIIANSDENLKDWTFITVDNPRMKVLLEKIIPSELLN